MKMIIHYNMRGILIDRFLQGIFAKTSKTIKNKGKNKMDKKLKKTPQIDAEFFLCGVFSVISAVHCDSHSFTESRVNGSLRFALPVFIMHYALRLRFVVIRFFPRRNGLSRAATSAGD